MVSESCTWCPLSRDHSRHSGAVHPRDRGKLAANAASSGRCDPNVLGDDDTPALERIGEPVPALVPFTSVRMALGRAAPAAPTDPLGGDAALPALDATRGPPEVFRCEPERPDGEPLESGTLMPKIPFHENDDIVSLTIWPESPLASLARQERSDGHLEPAPGPRRTLHAHRLYRSSTY